MLRVFLLGMLMACGGGESSTSPGVASGVAVSEAGKVRELTGKVTAARGSEVRTLAVGNPINGDDVIDTGADGSVVIELVHNNALWSLESGIKARVDQSPAWTLAKQAAAQPIDHATSAAGRHADRQAADTQVTAVEQGAARPAAAASPSTAPAVTGTSQDKGAERAQVPKSADAARPESAKPLPGCDEVSCVMNSDAACCARYRKSGKNTPSASDVPDAPDRSSIVAAMQVVRSKLARCFDKVTTGGTLKLVIKVGADGKVASAEIKETPDHAFDACVVAIGKTITLPPSKNGVTFSFPIVIRGPSE